MGWLYRHDETEEKLIAGEKKSAGEREETPEKRP